MTVTEVNTAVPAGNLMAGKRGLIMGVANNRSIAWGIAKAAAAQGAEVALTYQGDALKKRVEPLAAELGSNVVLPCDVTDAASSTPSLSPTKTNSTAVTSTQVKRTSRRAC
jgi:enoyl-[acyl-carrier protein] reductase I